MIIFIIAVITLIILVFGGLLLFGTLTDYKPEPEIPVYLSDESDEIAQDTEFSVLIWNIGYAGLSADIDFFYDGGKNVRPSKEVSMRNLQKISDYLASESVIDFYMIQEVDVLARRSWYRNQVETLRKVKPEYFSFFTPNFNVKFVPKPFYNPMGKVYSGLQTFSKFEPKSVIRYAFPGNYTWPTRIFMLDRCFMVARYNVSNGKELLIVNTHNSAYDTGGILRKGQLVFLKKYLIDEFEKGNYMVVGGDWNQCPPDLKVGFNKNVFDTVDYSVIDTNYLTADWKWVFDTTVATNRRVMKVYNKETSPQTLIDFYLVSPNIEVVEVKGIDLDFQYSDHQPVIAKFKMKL